MREDTLPPPTNESVGPQLHAALGEIRQIILEGLRHGHFSVTVSAEVGKGRRRELLVEAGKSHKFTIPENELPR